MNEQPETTTPEETPTAPKNPTQYVVLKQAEDGSPRWEQMDTTTAVSARAAIATVAENGAYGDGLYLAVPMRSFKPIPVTTETQTKLKLG